MRSKADYMTEAYLEAVAFTEFGEDGQPPKDAKFSQLAWAKAWQTCRNFLEVNEDLLGNNTLDSMAHMLWFTRSGVGASFNDDPEKWGFGEAASLTRCARCLGEVDVFLNDEGEVDFG